MENKADTKEIVQPIGLVPPPAPPSTHAPKPDQRETTPHRGNRSKRLTTKRKLGKENAKRYMPGKRKPPTPHQVQRKSSRSSLIHAVLIGPLRGH